MLQSLLKLIARQSTQVVHHFPPSPRAPLPPPGRHIPTYFYWGLFV